MNHLTLVETFESRFIKADEDECWRWRGYFSSGGYGALFFKGKRYLAHRISFWLYSGQGIKDESAAALARRLGLSDTTVLRARKQLTWKRLTLTSHEPSNVP